MVKHQSKLIPFVSDLVMIIDQKITLAEIDPSRREPPLMEAKFLLPIISDRLVNENEDLHSTWMTLSVAEKVIDLANAPDDEFQQMAKSVKCILELFDEFLTKPTVDNDQRHS